MRPVPGGDASAWSDPAGPDDVDRPGPSSGEDARLGAARRALHRLGGELRETSRALDGALDAASGAPDEERGGEGSGPRD
ncbi:hypothetical protein [Patulibacter sp.]|uniref:hypothetical protein n=1 Tax=Patulibacter sp. TaxID=1912859 RepID=UPI002727B00E|nr:hypothetical protein [Patulibacter sp.]MDO9408462.1 hypothetical protein [Patulibacter sp.]